MFLDFVSDHREGVFTGHTFDSTRKAGSIAPGNSRSRSGKGNFGKIDKEKGAMDFVIDLIAHRIGVLCWAC